MIILGWNKNPKDEIQALMDRFSALPRYIAKKHLQAAMKRTVADGVPVLRQLTPPLGVTRGRRRKGSFTALNRTTGNLRRSATTKAKYIGRNAEGVVYGVVGYRAGFNSRKAIWLEYGTRRGIRPQNIIEQFKQRYGQPSLARLATEMANALEKGAKELASGKNPGSPF